MQQIEGKLVDIKNKKIVNARVIFSAEKGISKIEEIPEAPNHFILPGFVDAHIHIESSMLIPSEFVD